MDAPLTSTGTGAARRGPCDSCGAPADDRTHVRRVYVTPEAWDTEGRVEVVDEVEMWCVPCRTSYPHQAVDDA
jgi:hypothetical protein